MNTIAQRHGAWFGCLILVGLASGATPRVLEAADDAAIAAWSTNITPSTLKAHCDVLASDTLEGREAGSRGSRAAAVYIVQRLRDLGVEPAGLEGTYYQEFRGRYRNILGRIPGSDAELSDEYICVGAHYDHVGLGNQGNSYGPFGYIHNGADDNASGTAALLEIAAALSAAPQSPRRSILIAFWDAEELGLWGSEHWLRRPTVARDAVRLAVNLDMVGRLRNDRVVVYGSRTSTGLRRLVSSQNRLSELELDFDWNVRPESDHYPFYRQRIPFLMLFTGKHADYHRPSDDVDKLNVAGMRRIAALTARVLLSRANDEMPIAFRSAAVSENNAVRNRQPQPPPYPARLGIGWQRPQDDASVVEVTRVTAGSPAAIAGLQPGDRIEELGGYRLGTDFDFRTYVLAAPRTTELIYRPAREAAEAAVSGTTKEEEERVRVAITLNGRPLRVGMSWRVDEAEPNSVIITRVAPGSPAAVAGVAPGDRLLDLDGVSVRPRALAERLSSVERAAELVLERDGQLRDATLKLLPRRESIATSAAVTEPSGISAALPAAVARAGVFLQTARRRTAAVRSAAGRAP